MKLFTLNNDTNFNNKKQHFAFNKFDNKSLCGLDLTATCFDVSLEELESSWTSCKKCIKKAKTSLK